MSSEATAVALFRNYSNAALGCVLDDKTYDRLLLKYSPNVCSLRAAAPPPDMATRPALQTAGQSSAPLRTTFPPGAALTHAPPPPPPPRDRLAAQQEEGGGRKSPAWHLLLLRLPGPCRTEAAQLASSIATHSQDRPAPAAALQVWSHLCAPWGDNALPRGRRTPFVQQSDCRSETPREQTAPASPPGVWQTEHSCAAAEGRCNVSFVRRYV